ncbi:uroporphyrinogen-III synthase [Neobacillus sp. LXY-1]|uniref:uroporphyrinogen-III synthase n=1 Tax=Neobacillus sp. LXY-1 TaxID=3379133 RepID=UPI003EDEAF78
MSNDLQGKKIVIAGSRKTEELCSLIENQGGIPVVRPLQGTLILDEEVVKPHLMRFIHEGADLVILTTGGGTEMLIDIAENLGVKEQFLAKIQNVNVAARGYKTLSTLKRLEIVPIATDEDGTVNGLMKALEGFDFSGKQVMVQLHGEPAPALTLFLEEKGAKVLTILPYQHVAPALETVSSLCKEIIENQVDAVCFTTGVQVRFLFEHARDRGCLTELINAFHSGTVAAAVGKVTADALREAGIERMVVPENERMGAMIITLSRYFREG